MLYTINNTPYAKQQYTMYYTLYAIYFSQYTIHLTLYTVIFTLYERVQPVGLISLSCNWAILHNEKDQMWVKIQ